MDEAEDLSSSCPGESWAEEHVMHSPQLDLQGRSSLGEPLACSISPLLPHNSALS